MSELKTYFSYQAADFPIWREFYLKSEADKVIRHNKYKRCLAMARWCELDIEQWIEGSFRWQRRKKWQKRWLELADKFKEGK